MTTLSCEIKTTVKGCLSTENNYGEIASTEEKATLPAKFEELHAEGFSKKYASLLSFREAKENHWTAIHIQGEYAENPTIGRVNDTRIFYNIDVKNLRNCEFKIGAIINSLPRMESINERNNNLHNNKINLEAVPFLKTDNLHMGLYRYIVQAIVEGKRLFIKLEQNTENYWKENNIFETIESKTLFAAIDHLPEKLRPVASFALSVDEKLNDIFLEHALIVLYYGDRQNLQLKEKKAEININWSELENNKDKKYDDIIAKYYPALTSSLVEQYQSESKDEKFSDLFNSWLSSIQMLDGLYEAAKGLIENHPLFIEKIKELESEKDLLRNNLNDSKEKNEKLQTQNEILQTQNDKLREQNDKLQEQNKKLSSGATLKSYKIRHLIVSLLCLLLAVSSIFFYFIPKEKIIEITDTETALIIQDLETKLEEANIEITKLNNKIKELETKQSSGGTDNQEEVRNLKKEIENLKTKLEEAKSDVERYKKAFDEAMKRNNTSNSQTKSETKPPTSDNTNASTKPAKLEYPFGTYTGGMKYSTQLRKWIPNGEGKMDYKKRVRIAKHDDQEHYAEAGYSLDGTWINGDISNGKLIDKNGKTEVILPGARNSDYNLEKDN
ncbi:MAG: hypothetical protein FWH18_02500 [Marinilabiliaceae bacterium]|nr:hypothetical protein [Marinilabiliaceae bacterium]